MVSFLPYVRTSSGTYTVRTVGDNDIVKGVTLDCDNGLRTVIYLGQFVPTISLRRCTPKPNQQSQMDRYNVISRK